MLGSAIGSNSEILEMLNFSAEHKITPMIERFPMSEVNKALARLAKNHVRYRPVLKSHRRYRGQPG